MYKIGLAIYRTGPGFHRSFSFFRVKLNKYLLNILFYLLAVKPLSKQGVILTPETFNQETTAQHHQQRRKDGILLPI